MEGRLWKENLTTDIETACAHCGRGLHLTLDNNLAFRVREQDANPLIFSPEVNWDQLSAPNIIQDF